MSRRFLVVAALVLGASVAQAQPVPPRPPKAPRPIPAPAPVPAPAPAPAVAPAVVPEWGDWVDLRGLEADLKDLRFDLDFDVAPMLDLDVKVAPMISARLADIDVLGQAARASARAYTSESAQYSRGTSYLDQGRYEQAVEAFDKVIASNDKRADAALYWKAYALNRLGRGGEALASLDELLKKFPTSRWANDAKALQVEVKQASGRPVNPSQQADDELKLIALNGLMSRDPEKAIPMVEQILAGSATPRMKERALFVLAQSGSPKAKTMMTDIARGKGNPDLQLKALDYLGVFGGGPDVPLLVDIYKSSSDLEVKRRIIRSLGMTGRHGSFAFTFGPELARATAAIAAAAPRIAAAASGEARAEAQARSDADYQRMLEDVRRSQQEAQREMERAQREAQREVQREMEEAHKSGAPMPPGRAAGPTDRDKAREAKAKEASDALWGLYQVEPSVDLKREILRNMYFGDQTDRLVQIARTDKDVSLRRAALQAMMFTKSPKTADTLVAIYRDEKDPSVKRQIIDVLGTFDTSAPLIQLARQENDIELKRTIVQRISFMKDKEATDFMMEILKK